jgi:CheY-like chemotaxis protein
VRILLVEDNPVNQRVGVIMLKKLGIVAVDLARNGREALEAVECGQYALILMDCQMPDIDGFEATRLLREREAAQGASRLPIIALTANALQGDRERCVAAGMDDYLTKPFTPQSLGDILSRWLKSAP